MRDWVVGGALIVSDEGLLLVQNRRRNGAHDWTSPGGVIDEGESLIDGLTREVREETGLRVTEWSGPLYEVRCRAPDLGGPLGTAACRTRRCQYIEIRGGEATIKKKKQ